MPPLKLVSRISAGFLVRKTPAVQVEYDRYPLLVIRTMIGTSLEEVRSLLQPDFLQRQCSECPLTMVSANRSITSSSRTYVSGTDFQVQSLSPTDFTTEVFIVLDFLSFSCFL